ncbi:DUF6965 family protein [Parapedobacter sp.]
MAIEALKTFFANHPIPENTMFNATMKIADPRLFLETNLNVVDEWKGNLDKCPSYWHLCDLVKVLDPEHGIEYTAGKAP